MKSKINTNRRLPAVVRNAVEAAKSSKALRAEWDNGLFPWVFETMPIEEKRIKVAGATMKVFARHGYVLTAQQALQVGTLVYPYKGQ